MRKLKRKLPIGIQTFREIREDNCYYVDKTPYIRRLLDEGKHYFLSRPRRFGKSLFVDTLKELFEGNEPLFRGLDVHGNWDWATRHPVIRLDYSRGDYRTPAGKAMTQLKAKGYADKYRHLGQPIHLVGVEFSRETRNLTAFVVENA